MFPIYDEHVNGNCVFIMPRITSKYRPTLISTQFLLIPISCYCSTKDIRDSEEEQNTFYTSLKHLSLELNGATTNTDIAKSLLTTPRNWDRPFALLLLELPNLLNTCRR